MKAQKFEFLKHLHRRDKLALKWDWTLTQYNASSITYVIDHGKKRRKKTREFSAGGLKSEASCLSAMADRDAGENWKEAACHCSIAPCSTKAVRDPHKKKSVSGRSSR